MTTNDKTRRWKKETIPCWDCGEPSCAENGDHHWYCFRCFVMMDVDPDEVEIDDTLQICPQQLKIQSKEFSQ